MKKRVRYSSAIVIALLAVAPVVMIDSPKTTNIVKADSEHIAGTKRITLKKQDPSIKANDGETVADVKKQQIADAAKDVTANNGTVTKCDYMNIYPDNDGTPDYKNILKDTDQLSEDKDYDAVLGFSVDDIHVDYPNQDISYTWQEKPTEAPKLNTEFDNTDTYSIGGGYDSPTLTLPVYVGKNGKQNRKAPIPPTEIPDDYKVTGGDIEEHAIEIDARIDPDFSTKIHPGDNLNEVFDKVVNVYVGGHKINNKHEGGYKINKERSVYGSFYSDDANNDKVFEAGCHYRTFKYIDYYDYPDEYSEGITVNNLEPNKWYKYTDPKGKELTFHTDESGQIEEKDLSKYKDGVVLDFNYEFVPGKRAKNLDEKYKDEEKKGRIRYIPDRQLSNTVPVKVEYDKVLQNILKNAKKYLGTQEIKIKYRPNLTANDIEEYFKEHTKIFVGQQSVPFNIWYESDKIQKDGTRKIIQRDANAPLDRNNEININLGSIEYNFKPNTWYQWQQWLKISDAFTGTLPKELADRLSQKTLKPEKLYLVGYKTDEQGKFPSIINKVNKDKGQDEVTVNDFNRDILGDVMFIVSADPDAIDIPKAKNDSTEPLTPTGSDDDASTDPSELDELAGIYNPNYSDTTDSPEPDSKSHPKPTPDNPPKPDDQSNIRYVLKHKSFIYDKNGKPLKTKHGRYVSLHKYLGIKIEKLKKVRLGKGHKEYVQIGKGKYVKANNIMPVPKAKKLKNRVGIIKVYKVVLYDGNGKKVGKIKLKNNKRFKLYEQKWVKGHLYYKIKLPKKLPKKLSKYRNQLKWIRSNCVKVGTKIK